MTLFVKNFWGEVLRRPTDGHGRILFDLDLGEPEVCEADVALGVNQNILGLEAE